MRRVIPLSLLTVLLAACTAAPASPPSVATLVVQATATGDVRPTQPAAVTATASLPAVTATPAPPDPTATRPAPSATARPIDDAFRPSDPNGVVLAAGRPQLVEFYAVW